ncbi:DUF3606 domain-containing protein [Siphonobacter sp. BAB-5405]|nr:DUF3606 domain-containing protein [Siphonobacter sp. BAB-5405]
MPDNLSNRGPRDRSRINLNEEWEVRYWTSELGCTAARLRQAVNAVGVMVADVRRYLATR